MKINFDLIKKVFPFYVGIISLFLIGYLISYKFIDKNRDNLLESVNMKEYMQIILNNYENKLTNRINDIEEMTTNIKPDNKYEIYMKGKIIKLEKKN